MLIHILHIWQRAIKDFKITKLMEWSPASLTINQIENLWFIVLKEIYMEMEKILKQKSLGSNKS